MATLKDLERELWLRRRNAGDISWTTKDGKVIPIKNMTMTHLINTIKMLRTNIAKRVERDAIQAEYEALKAEYEDWAWENLTD